MRPTKHLRYLSIVCLGSLLEKVLFAVSTHAQQFAYVTNSSSSSVSVIDTATNSVTCHNRRRGEAHGSGEFQLRLSLRDRHGEQYRDCPRRARKCCTRSET